MLDESGANQSPVFVQHALESFLGLKIPEDKRGVVFLQGDWVRVSMETNDIILKDEKSILNDFVDC